MKRLLAIVVLFSFQVTLASAVDFVKRGDCCGRQICLQEISCCKPSSSGRTPASTVPSVSPTFKLFPAVAISALPAIEAGEDVRSRLLGFSLQVHAPPVYLTKSTLLI